LSVSRACRNPISLNNYNVQHSKFLSDNGDHLTAFSNIGIFVHGARVTILGASQEKKESRLELTVNTLEVRVKTVYSLVGKLGVAFLDERPVLIIAVFTYIVRFNTFLFYA
jgi:hypothetical protein